MSRTMAALAALALSAAVLAQTNTATRQVQLLAPQLVAFAGSIGNFESLVTGLTTGAPVTLVRLGSDGSLQIVTFVPGTTLSPLDAARLLEAARQNLITHGIANPTGSEIAASLLGGSIQARSGPNTMSGLLTGSTTPPTPVQVRTEPPTLAARGSGSITDVGTLTMMNGSAVPMQGVLQGRAPNTSDSPVFTGPFFGAPPTISGIAPSPPVRAGVGWR